jgi:drug/metabolite transporter superfamily protein YnfA
MRKTPALAVAALAVAVTATVATAAPASAKGRAAAQSGANLVATPGVVTFTDSNAYETFTGCGYQAESPTTIVLTTPSAVSWFGGMSDSAGCINFSHNGFIELAGTYYVVAWQDNARTGKSTAMARTTFTVRASAG